MHKYNYFRKGIHSQQNYCLYFVDESPDEIRVLKHGQYALIETIAKDIRNTLEEHFPLDHTSQFFMYVSILYANSFVHMDQVQGYYELYNSEDLKKDVKIKSYLLEDILRAAWKHGKIVLFDIINNRSRISMNYDPDEYKNKLNASFLV